MAAVTSRDMMSPVTSRPERGVLVFLTHPLFRFTPQPAFSEHEASWFSFTAVFVRFQLLALSGPVSVRFPLRALSGSVCTISTYLSVLFPTLSPRLTPSVNLFSSCSFPLLCVPMLACVILSPWGVTHNEKSAHGGTFGWWRTAAPRPGTSCI